MTYYHRLRFSALMVGWISLWSQLSLLRISLSIFHGNELVIGICMFQWLIGIFAGAWYGKRLRRTRLEILLLVQGVLIPVCGLLLKFYPVIWDLSPVLSQGYPLIFLLTALSFLPVCFMFGVFFSVISHKLTEDNPFGGEITYAVEALGSGLSGLIFGFILLSLLNSMEILLFSGALFITIGFLINIMWWTRTSRWILQIIIPVLLIFPFAVRPGKIIEQLRFPRFRVVDAFETPYQPVHILKYEDILSLMSYEKVIKSLPGTYIDEEITLFPFLVADSFQSALFMGLYSEVSIELLNHLDVDSVKVVYHDDHLLRALGRYKVTVYPETIAEDERAYLRRAEAGNPDIISMNLPEPVNAVTNRFYTVEFFTSVRNRLAEGGMFHLVLSGAANRFNDEQIRLYQSILNSVRQVFHHVQPVWGAPAHILASDHPVSLSEMQIAGRWDQLGEFSGELQLCYLLDKISGFRQESFQYFMDRSESRTTNRDLKPVSYRFAIQSWLVMTRSHRLPHQIGFYVLLTVIVIFTGSVITGELRRNRGMIFIYAAAFFIGMISMGIQMLIVCMNQLLMGNLYWMLTLIISTFMIGLSAGGYTVIRTSARSPGELKIYGMLFLLVPFILIPLFIYGDVNSNVMGNILFVLLSFLSGAGSGFFFNLLLRYQAAGNTPYTPGTIYATDSLGASLAAFTVMSVFIPVLGIFNVVLFGIFLVVMFYFLMKKNERIPVVRGL